MFSKKLVVSAILAATMATSVYAGPSCPKAADVKGAYRALNTVMRQSEQSYFVLTGQPAFNQSGYDWILIAQAKGNSFDPAFSAGESDVRSVASSLSDEPVEMQGVFVCGYFTSSGGMNVMAIAPQQQDVTLNPAKLKLNELVKFGK